MVRTLLLLCVLFAVSQAQQKTPWKELFALDCNGTFHIGTSSVPVHFQVNPLGKFMDYSVTQMRNTVNCKCAIPSQLSEQEFQRRFVPGVSAGINMAAGPHFQVDDQTTCPRSSFARDVNNFGFFGINLPTSCSLANWEAGKPCYAKWSVPSLSMDLQVALDHCGSSYLPYVSVSCAGAGCTYLFKPCQTNADCGGMTGGCAAAHNNTLPNFYNDIFKFLKDMYLYDDMDQSPGCYSPASVIDYLQKLVLVYFTTAVPTTPFTDFKFCGADFNNEATTDAISDDFSCSEADIHNNMTCSNLDWVETYSLVSCPNLKTWDGVLSDGSSAVAANRKSGAAFLAQPMKPAFISNDARSLLDIQCDGTFSVFGSELYSTFFKVDFTYLLNGLNTFLQNVQKCRGFTLTQNQFRQAYGIWGIDYWGNVLFAPAQANFTHGRSTLLNLLTDSIDYTSSSDDGKVRRDPGSTYGTTGYSTTRYATTGYSTDGGVTYESDSSEDDNFRRIIMPESCNLATWQSSGTCSLKFTGLKDLLNADITIRARFSRCPGSEWMQGSIECEGVDCVNLMQPKLCQTDSDCPSNFICYDLLANSTLTYKDYNPLALFLWGVDDDTGASCPSNAMKFIPASETCNTKKDSWYSMIRNALPTFTGRPTPTTATGLSMCLFDWDKVSDNIDDWSNKMATNDGADVSLTGLVTWNNAPALTPTSASSGSGSGSGSSGTTKAKGSDSSASVPVLAMLATCMLALLFLA